MTTTRYLVVHCDVRGCHEGVDFPEQNGLPKGWRAVHLAINGQSAQCVHFCPAHWPRLKPGKDPHAHETTHPPDSD